MSFKKQFFVTHPQGEKQGGMLFFLFSFISQRKKKKKKYRSSKDTCFKILQIWISKHQFLKLLCFISQKDKRENHITLYFREKIFIIFLLLKYYWQKYKNLISRNFKILLPRGKENSAVNTFNFSIEKDMFINRSWLNMFG